MIWHYGLHHRLRIRDCYVKNSQKFTNCTKFLIFVRIRFIKSSNSHNNYNCWEQFLWNLLHWDNHWMGINSGQLRTAILNWVTQWSCRRFVDFVIGRSWSCWTVDELMNLELLTSYRPNIVFIEKLSAVFASKSLLELGSDECDTLNFYEF